MDAKGDGLNMREIKRDKYSWRDWFYQNSCGRHEPVGRLAEAIIYESKPWRYPVIGIYLCPDDAVCSHCGSLFESKYPLIFMNDNVLCKKCNLLVDEGS